MDFRNFNINKMCFFFFFSLSIFYIDKFISMAARIGVVLTVASELNLLAEFIVAKNFNL